MSPAVGYEPDAVDLRSQVGGEATFRVGAVALRLASLLPSALRPLVLGQVQAATE